MEAEFKSHVLCRTQAPGRPSGSRGKVGDSGRQPGRGWKRMQGSFQTLLHPPESHGNVGDQEAGGRSGGGGGRASPCEHHSGGRRRGACGQQGKLGRGWGGGVQLQLRPIHFLPPPLRPFQGRGPPKTSFSGRSGGAPPIGTGDWPPHSQQIPRQPTARLTPPTPSPGAAPPSYPHVQPQARQAAGGPQMPISSPRSSVFLVPVLHLQMSN